LLTGQFLDFGMATREQSLAFQNSAASSHSTVSTKVNHVPRRDAARVPASDWKSRPLFALPKLTQRIASNLFSVVETPKVVFAAESQFRTEQEIIEACGGAGALPFLLKGSTLHTFAPLTKGSVFGLALKKDDGAVRQEQFAVWLSDALRSNWAIDLLNRFLCLHAWKRGLRFDESHALFYFTRSKPKKLWWEVGGKIALREVTAPHIKHYQIDDRREVEFQCGWKHEAVRAGFVLQRDSLFVQLEPAWFLTELDGKTPATSQRVAPLNSPRLNPHAEELLRALSFWSAVFAKGHRELRIETGGAPIRVRLISPSSSAPRIVSKEDRTLDYFALTNMEDDGAIPELGLMQV
jgi:hypothetical protein